MLPMQKIGLIGGLSWVSTAEYYRAINTLVQEELGGVRSARLVLESVDRQAYVDAVIERRDEAAAGAMILDAARSLEKAGAAFLVICCNDVHRFVPTIQPEIGIPFLHIAEATAAAILEAGLRSVAILGVRKTMESDFYPSILAAHGIRAIIPDEAGKAFVHDTIYEELVQNVFHDTTRKRYVSLIEDLHRKGAEGAVLACTEIPLLVRPDHLSVPTFSTTGIHCRAAVRRAIHGH